MNRREFLRYSFLTSVFLGLTETLLSCGGGIGGSFSSSPNDVQVSSSTRNPLNLPGEGGGLFGYFYPDSQPFTLEASPDEFEIVPGKITRNLLTYKVGNYVNPILVLRKGESLVPTFVNRTGEESIVHWHGLRVPWRSDGHPLFTVRSGESYCYREFRVIDRSGTYFYHPHPHGITGYQVYRGLAGIIIVEDEDEDNLKRELDLQYGITDIPLVIQDRNLDSDAQLIYDPMGMNGSLGFWGNNVLVNLTLNPYLEVERRIYRFRILNGSNARPYRLALLRGRQKIPFFVIGVEGGLLNAPVRTDEILVAPGERADILVDFRLVNEGDVLKLYSLQHNLIGMGGMGSGGRTGSSRGGMNGGMMNLINREFEILEFRVVRDSSYDRQIPSRLSDITPIDTTDATTQDVVLGMSVGSFNIDGKTWDSSNPLADYGYNYNNGDIVVFRITNMTGMYHPMHFHGFQFQVLSRSSGSLRPTDLGWKDTVIVGPHETVVLAMEMRHNFGEEQVYLFHCHILEHHDMGMMVNFRVSA